MFGRAFKIGTLLGFRIEISVSFLIILGVFVLMGASSGGAAGALGGLIAMTILFSSVLLHELGHSVVARRLGIQILGIELHFMGGAAKMAQPPRSAREEIIIAVAGPAVSFGLAGIAFALSLATGGGFFGLLALINLLLGTFNLLPALPMDGGRVLRAVLSERLGRYRATLVAASVAQWLAIGLLTLGVIQTISPFLTIAGLKLSGPALAIVGVLVWLLAAQERAMAGRWRYVDEAPEAQVLDPSGRVISGYDPYGPPASHHPDMRGEPEGRPPARRPGSPGLVRRVYRLPNGMVMVVEEYVRW